MEKKHLKYDVTFILKKMEIINNTVSNQMQKHVDHLTDYFDRLLACHERLVARVEEIEAKIEDGAPAKVDGQTGTPRTDKRKSGHHLTILQ